MQETTSQYRCPSCGGSLRWSMVNGRVGASTDVICANNVAATRVSWNPKVFKMFCHWEGKVVRQKDGSVKYYYKDGITILRPYIK